MATVQWETARKSVRTVIVTPSGSALPEGLGFVHLGDVLRATLAGQIDSKTLSGLQDRLWDRLETAQKQLEGLSARSWAASKASHSHLLESTEALMEELGTVLELIDEFLDFGSQNSVSEAISVLDVIQEQFGQVFS